MVFDRSLADAKIRSDVLALASGQNELHDLILPIGEIVDVVMGRRTRRGKLARAARSVKRGEDASH